MAYDIGFIPNISFLKLYTLSCCKCPE